MKLEWQMSDQLIEIDVHGKTVFDAEYEVDLAIDAAALGKEEVLRVIVGRGSGRLFSEIKTYLRNHPRVSVVHDSNAPHEIGAVLYPELKG